ncbi:MAG: zinc ABC transporter substrate-binding protein [Candidatus Aegiribacteria sp.]
MRFRGQLTDTLAGLAAVCLLAASGCGTGEDTGHRAVTAAVSILPQKYFLERLGGDRVEVIVVVPPGASPATYEPSPSDMRRISGARVWFTVGVAFEDAWIPRFEGSGSELEVVSTIRDIQRRPLGRYSVETLSFDEDEEHGHSHDEGSPDPHVWLSPELVRKQVSVMAEVLSELDPEGSETYMDNLGLFMEEIDSLQNEIGSLLEDLDRRRFMVFHPAWGYFADEFGLVQVPVESMGSEPSPREMSILIDHARENDITTVFVSPQFSTSSAETIARELGGGVARIDPLAEDWPDNLYRVAEKLAEEASR